MASGRPVMQSPWQFRKTHGHWQKRPINTNQKWSTLQVTQVGQPREPRTRSERGTGKVAPPSINRWTWTKS